MRLSLWVGLLAALLSACSGQQVLNTLTPTGGYGRLDAQAYGPARHQRLDLYVPHQVRDAPMVLFLHGGRWQEGARADYAFVGQALASQGFIAAVADFNRYPVARFPEIINDAALALRWLRQNGVRYGGNAARLFVMGHSSGAQMAALLALDPRHLEAVGGSRDWLRGMVGLAGAYDFMPITSPDLRDLFGPPERFPDSQPVNFCDGRNPPLLLLHGEDDDTVWVSNSRSLAAAVARAGGVAETVLYPEMGHAWILATLAAPLRGRSDVLSQVADFVIRRSAGASAEAAVRSRGLEP